MKKKIKQSLLNEYIFILNIQKIFKNYNYLKDSDINYCVKLCESLKKKYEQIFFKIGLMDLSFMILKKELNNKEMLKYEKFLNLKDNLKDIRLRLNDYLNDLSIKMKKLMFNEFEINFIVNFS